MFNKIYVGNLSPETTDKDLFDLFSKIGIVISAKISLGTDKKNTQHGYVIMEDEKIVQKAVETNSNLVLKGNHLRVLKAHPIDQDSNYFSNKNRFRRFTRK